MVATVTSLERSKNKFRIDYLEPQNSTNSEHLAKIGPVSLDVEIISLTDIVKNEYKNKRHEQNKPNVSQ